ncbi:MAG: hypothetical protein OK454_08170 [Thaumarchaeota archaeon]|nr:hypothetical protein [Nitrososphaerota archaeon]
MDTDYLGLALLMGLFGAVGLTATAHVTPNVLAMTDCNCIPSPASRLQELSAIFVVAGLVLLPIGLKKGPKTPTQMMEGGNRLMRSGSMFALGIAMTVLGIGLVLAPAVLVLMNGIIVAEGVGVILVGIFFVYNGGRSG